MSKNARLVWHTLNFKGEKWKAEIRQTAFLAKKSKNARLVWYTLSSKGEKWKAEIRQADFLAEVEDCKARVVYSGL